jgi:prepilin-type N-terminal cleavage/methylation domain-containing protein
MLRSNRRQEHGFSLVECIIVFAVIATVLGIATPKIARTLRQYKINTAMRQMADVIQKAKVEAVAENRKASLVVDSASRKFGLVVYDDNQNIIRTDYVPLPDGVNFARPTGMTAPLAGAPTSSDISFPSQGGSTTKFQQDFTSRGFLKVVTPGDMHAVYFSNGGEYRAITVNSIGGVQTWQWDGNGWKSTRA